MGLLSSNISKFRNDPRILKVPPYLALLCMLGGIIWMLLLPLDEYSRRTYISENALLPGQVHTYFTGSEQNIFRAYRHVVASLLEPKAIDDEEGQPSGRYVIATDAHRTAKLESILREAGLKTARQTYKYETSGKIVEGENIYTIVHGPRADGTESIVLVAPIRNIYDQLNVNGVTLLLTLARYFSRWSLWSKDIILIITPDAITGTQAWVDAYHSMHDSSRVADLSLKSGHIQGAICIDYPSNHRFETLHVSYDGVNGQLPNLDLINTAISIASGQMGIATTIQNQHEFTPAHEQANYLVRLRTLFHGMTNQAVGHVTGAHSVFMPYHIDAITLTAIGEGWQDEMAFGRTIESCTRSLNNLLEKLHQSFFFYLLLQNTRFVSIGTYLPSAMAVGAGFTIVAIFAWVQGGYEQLEVGTDMNKQTERTDTTTNGKQGPSDSASDQKVAEPMSNWRAIERPLTLPIAVLSATYLLPLIPVYLLTRSKTESFLLSFTHMSLTILGTPVIIAELIKVLQTGPKGSAAAVLSPSTDSDVSHALTIRTRTTQIYTILSSLSLLILGLLLTVLATLNFSLSIFLGIVCSPLAFIGYNAPPPPVLSAPATPSPKLRRHQIQSVLSTVLVVIFSPPVLLVVVAALDRFYSYSAVARTTSDIVGTLNRYISQTVFAFNVWGSWGALVGIWGIWVPAWIVSAASVFASFLSVEPDQQQEEMVKAAAAAAAAAANGAGSDRVLRDATFTAPKKTSTGGGGGGGSGATNVSTVKARKK